MLKEEFISKLRDKLVGLPQKEVEERLTFYGEMIEDRIEEGNSEEDAVAAIGTVDDVYAQIVAEMPLVSLVRERMRPNRRMRTREVLLLVLGSPIWISLLVAAFAVVLSVFVSLWAGVIALWTVPVCFAAGALGGVLGTPLFWYAGNIYTGLLMLGAGLACAGLAIFAFFACKVVMRLSAIATKYMIVCIKWMLVGKGARA